MGLSGQFFVRRADWVSWSGTIDFSANVVAHDAAPTLVAVDGVSATAVPPLPPFRAGTRVIASPSTNVDFGFYPMILPGPPAVLNFLFVNTDTADANGPGAGLTWHLLFFHDPAILDAAG